MQFQRSYKVPVKCRSLMDVLWNASAAHGSIVQPTVTDGELCVSVSCMVEFLWVEPPHGLTFLACFLFCLPWLHPGLS